MNLLDTDYILENDAKSAISKFFMLSLINKASLKTAQIEFGPFLRRFLQVFLHFFPIFSS